MYRDDTLLLKQDWVLSDTVVGGLMSDKSELIDGRTYRKKVRAFIYNEKFEFLLIRPKHYKPDSWSFVGGGTESEESLEQSIRREIREEVGLEKLISLQKSKNTNHYLYKPDFQKQYDGQIAYYFIAQVNSNEPVTIQTEELADYCWVNFENIHTYVKVKEQLDFFMLVAHEFGFDSGLKEAV